MGQFVVTDS